MKRLISLALCGYFSFSWAGEFKLQFSKEIIDATQDQREGFETPDASMAINPKNPNAVPSLSPLKSKSHSADFDPPDKIQVSPTEHKPFVNSSRLDSSRAVNDFSPLRVSPSSVFGGMVQQNEQFGQFGIRVPNSEQNQNNLDVFGELHDEIKLMVGDDVYTKMAWSYDNVKELDNWLSATLKQLTLQDGGSISVGLDDQVIANFTTLGQIGVPGQNGKSLEDRHAEALNTPEYAARYGINQATIRANFENQSKFLVVLKYLTISNFLYAIFSFVALFYAGKFFRFLIKQR